MKHPLSITLVCLVFLIQPIVVFAQYQKYAFGFRYGYSLPMGQFSSHKYNDGAYALFGATASIEGIYYLNENLGFGLNISGSSYPIAVGFFLQDKDSADADFTYIHLKSSPYYLRSFTGGIYYRIPFAERFNISFKGLGGILWALSPDQMYAARSNLQTDLVVTWEKTSSRSIRASFIAGTALNYKLFTNVDLMLETEFSYGRSIFGFRDLAGNRTEQKIKMPLFKMQSGLNITF